MSRNEFIAPAPPLLPTNQILLLLSLSATGSVSCPSQSQASSWILLSLSLPSSKWSPCHVSYQTCPLLSILFAITHPPGGATITFHLDCCKVCQLVLLALIHSPQKPAGSSKREIGQCHFLPYFPSIVLRVKSSQLNVVYKAFHDFSSLRSSLTILGSSLHICHHPHSYPPDSPWVCYIHQALSSL